MRMIVGLHELEPLALEQIQRAAPDWKIVCGKVSQLDPSLFHEAEILMSWNGAVAEEALKPDSKLRWVQVLSAGVDRLPLDQMEKKGIILTDGSGIHPHPMSETALSMMLAFTRQLHTFIRNQSQGIWHRHAQLGEMHGRTAAIIGVGEIGMEMARLCKAFGMRVLGVRRSGKSAPHVDEMFDVSGLSMALAESDYVINILPLTDETRHIFNDETFGQMKQGAYYINIGRGATTDTGALLHALQEGRLAGAGLDVMEEEPLPQDHPLWSMEQVILTPHIGGAHEHYNTRMIELFVENLKAYLRTGKPGRNLVDYRLGY